MKKYIIEKILKKVTNFEYILDEHEGLYDGECKNNKMHGSGKFTFYDGYAYEGTFENGKRIGRGKLYFPLLEEWEVFEGYFNEDFTCDKEGKLICRDGTIYEGQWNDGKYHGIGKITYPNGNIYKGNFVNDKMDGIGKMIYKDCVIKYITAVWIDENKVDYDSNIKIEFDYDLLNKFKDIKEQIESFDVLPNIEHKYIPVLGKKTKIAELKYILLKKI